MSKLKFNSLINLKLTQESGQTSQAPWFCIDDDKGFTNYYELLFLNNLNNLDKLDNLDSDNLNNLPVLAKVSQNPNDLSCFELDYQLSDCECTDSYSDNEITSAVKDEISKIFNLDFDLENFYKNLIDEDDKLADSIDFCNGLRLFIARDKFECIISSICSANNSITRWTKSTNQIKSNWGFNRDFILNNFSNNSDSGITKSFYGFPKLSELADKDLKSCGVGYREDYMKKSEDLLLNEIDIDEIDNMSYDEAFETISKLPGVGPKVADCILLYGYGFMEAFPSDVWIKRIVSYLYFDGKEISAKKTRDFGMEHFGENAGYAQLYLFHYARKSGLMDKLKK